jgi:hypothetical protein
MATALKNMISTIKNFKTGDGMMTAAEHSFDQDVRFSRGQHYLVTGNVGSNSAASRLTAGPDSGLLLRTSIDAPALGKKVDSLAGGHEMNRFADDANADHDRLGKQSFVHGQTPQLLRRPRLQPLMTGAAMSKKRASRWVPSSSIFFCRHEFLGRLQHTQQAGVGYEHQPGLCLGFPSGQRCNAAFANSIAVWASARRRPFVQKIDEIVKVV